MSAPDRNDKEKKKDPKLPIQSIGTIASPTPSIPLKAKNKPKDMAGGLAGDSKSLASTSLDVRRFKPTSWLVTLFRVVGTLVVGSPFKIFCWRCRSRGMTLGPPISSAESSRFGEAGVARASVLNGESGGGGRLTWGSCASRFGGGDSGVWCRLIILSGVGNLSSSREEDHRDEDDDEWLRWWWCWSWWRWGWKFWDESGQRSSVKTPWNVFSS